MQAHPQPPRILIVDDDYSICKLNRRILEADGFRCIMATTAEEAREHLARSPFDLILCDVHMPGESGFDLVRRALCDYPELAAVFITGDSDPTLADGTFAVGACDFITKPIERERLLIGVRNALLRREQTLLARLDNVRLE